MVVVRSVVVARGTVVVPLGVVVRGTVVVRLGETDCSAPEATVAKPIVKVQVIARSTGAESIFIPHILRASYSKARQARDPGTASGPCLKLSLCLLIKQSFYLSRKRAKIGLTTDSERGERRGLLHSVKDDRQRTDATEPGCTR